MTYNVFGGTLNLTQSNTISCYPLHPPCSMSTHVMYSCLCVGKVAHRLHMAKVTNYVLADRDTEPYYVAVHIPGSKVKMSLFMTIVYLVVYRVDIKK